MPLNWLSCLQGTKNEEVTRVIQKIADIYGCNPIEGVLSHQMKRYVIDGNKVILNKPNQEHKVEICAFEENEVSPSSNFWCRRCHLAAALSSSLLGTTL